MIGMEENFVQSNISAHSLHFAKCSFSSGGSCSYSSVVIVLPSLTVSIRVVEPKDAFDIAALVRAGCQQAPRRSKPRQRGTWDVPARLYYGPTPLPAEKIVHRAIARYDRADLRQLPSIS